MTLKKTCACGKNQEKSDSIGNFKNQKTDQELKENEEIENE